MSEEKDEPKVAFRGQQEGERILYLITPHWTRRIVDFAGGLGAGLSVALVAFQIAPRMFWFYDTEYVVTTGIIMSLLAFAVVYGWLTLKTNNEKGFITDRRFMRLQLMFPWFILKRSLFWNEVGKVKGYEPNLFLRTINVGRIGLDSFVVTNASLEFRYVYYFEDLANYIDKILYMYKNKPHELVDLKSFILKPAGQRY